MTNLLYFPGFRSTGHKTKDHLIPFCKENNLNLVIIEYPSYDPIEIEKYVNSIIDSLGNPLDTVIYGASYGGYWAIQTALRYDLPVIVLNPSINIQNSGLSRASSKNISYISSFDGSKTFALCDEFVHNHKPINFKSNLNIDAFVCDDDNVVKPDYFVNKMSGLGRKVTILNGGGHSGHKHINIIMCKIKEKINRLGV